MRVEKVALSLTGGRGYDVIIGYGLIPRIGKYMRKVSVGEQVAVVTHPRIERLYGKEVMTSLKGSGFSPILIRIPEGEQHKTLSHVNRIYDVLIERRFERSSTLIALGGGVVGDMTGFAAASFLRGISYIQCPTSVVAQVDAAIGGKTGVDHPKGKNLIGAFHHPSLVFIDPATLQTLSKREFVAGLAEIVKYGVISDPRLFSFMEANVAAILDRDKRCLTYCIKRSVEIKAHVVMADEKESGLRKILNYGHTLGHAIETLTGYQRYKHGEAIAIGMVAAAQMAYRLGIGGHELVVRQRRLLEAFGLPTDLPNLRPDDLLDVMASDKKVMNGEIYFVLPEKIGHVRVEKIGRRALVGILNGFCLN